MPHILLLLLLVLVLLLVISFTQDIYNYIPQRRHIYRLTYRFAGVLYLQANASCIIITINVILLPQTSHVSRYRRSFAAILWSQHTVHLMLFPILNIFYFHITTFPNNSAVSSKSSVQTSSMSCFTGTLLNYFLKIVEMVPVIPTILKFHISSNPIVRPSYFKIFVFLLEHTSLEISMSTNKRFTFSLNRSLYPV
jgi:hypothetical protein